MKKLNRVGEKHTTNQGYEVEIIEYFGKKNCTIRFEDGLILKKIIYDNLKRGKVKNPFHKTVFGVGYIGIGKYVPTINRILKKEYRLWRGMLQRCYSKNSQEKYPTYQEVTVCEHWHNFQNFAKWFEENYNPEIMEGWEIDKDILVKGNKIYSPDTCCFVPKEINYLFLKSNNARGKYPIGVSFDKEKQKFLAQVNRGNIRGYVGRYKTIEEAFQSHKIKKEQYIKEVADKYKKEITEATYQAMYNYQVEITD